MAEFCVVGAGPAGIAAAIQLTRAGHAVTVVEGRSPGGTVRNARRIDNYPGFSDGISGPDLAELLGGHLTRFVPEIVHAHVEQVVHTDPNFVVFLRGGGTLGPFIGIVLATGSCPRRAMFPGETKLAKARLLSYEVSDLLASQPSAVLVVGGGEAAMDYALSCADRDLSVTVLSRSPLTGIHSLVQELKAHPEIRLLHGEIRAVRRHEGQVHVETSAAPLVVDHLLVAVGREACLPVLSGFDADNPSPGLQIAGDLARGRLGQVAIAVGDGIAAAMILDEELGG